VPFAAGIFTRNYSWTADAAANITAQPTRFDADANDMATGLTSCLLRDGTGTPTANIGWGGYRITGLADPVNPQDAATKNYVMITMVGIYLPVAGGTLTGNLIVGLASNGLAVVAPGNSTATGYFQGSNADGSQNFYLGTGGALTDVPFVVNGGRSVTFNTKPKFGTAFLVAQGDAITAGIVTSNGIELGFRDVPQNPQAAAYTLALTDRGQHIYYTGAAVAITIPANATVAFPIGAATTIVNDGTGALSLTRAAGVTMKLVGTGANLDRSLAIAGIATLLKVGTNTWFLSGTGIT